MYNLVCRKWRSAGLIILLALQACAAKAPNATSPADPSLPAPISSVSDLNKSLTITVDTPPPYHFDVDIEFEATNMSQNNIQMAPDFDIKLFLREQNGWTQIGNNATYHGGNIILAVQRPGEIWYQSSSGVRPVLNGGAVLQHDQTLRIYIQGTMLSPSNEPDGAVGAYADITLSP